MIMKKQEDLKDLMLMMHDCSGDISIISSCLYLIERDSLNEQQIEKLNLANKRLKDLNITLDNYYKKQKENER